jgi:chemotaxis protein histidine kinase CheA
VELKIKTETLKRESEQKESGLKTEMEKLKQDCKQKEAKLKIEAENLKRESEKETETLKRDRKQKEARLKTEVERVNNLKRELEQERVRWRQKLEQERDQWRQELEQERDRRRQELEQERVRWRQKLEQERDQWRQELEQERDRRRQVLETKTKKEVELKTEVDKLKRESAQQNDRSQQDSDREKEKNEKEEKLSADMFYHDPLNCTDLKAITKESTFGKFGAWISEYYPEIDLTYSDGKTIRFEERANRTYSAGSNGLVVHYESQNDPVTICFSIKYTDDDGEEKIISKINRTQLDGSKPCGQIKIKNIRRSHHPLSNGTLYLFLSKTYEGDLRDFTDEDKRLDKKRVQNIIIEVRNQLICLKKKHDMCYMDIKPDNILYLYPDKSNREIIEVALGDLGSDGISSYKCVSSETNTTYQRGKCKDDELLSDCQKYTLSLTYLILRDGYTYWHGIAIDPDRKTVRTIQNVLRSDLISGGKTMYEIIWEPEAEATEQRPDPKKNKGFP